MTADNHETAKEALRSALRRSADCVPIENLDTPLDADARRHLDGCVRCQTEFALWENLRDAAPDAGDGAASQWIAAEVRRRRAPSSAAAKSAGWWTFFAPRRALAAAAVVTLIASGVFVAWDRAPEVDPQSPAEGGYRGIDKIQPVAPLDEVQLPPAELEWEAVENAARYEVTVLEVDRTVVWRGATPDPRIRLPQSIVSIIVPGKSLLWEVRALNPAGVGIGQSGTLRFRRSVR